MNKVVARALFLLVAACVLPLAAWAQSEWTYVVTGKAGKEGLQAYYLSGDPAFTLKKGDVVEVSAFHDDFPAKDAPGKCCRVAIITADMEDYVIYLDREDLLVPKSQYRYERLFSGLGGLVGRHTGKSPAMLCFGVGYLLLLLYASRRVLRPRGHGAQQPGRAAGWVLLALYAVLLGCEAYYLLAFSNPFWFIISFREVGIVRGLLFLLLMVVYLYLKYAVACLSLGTLQHTRRLQDTEFNIPGALLLTVAGTWLFLTLETWEANFVPCLLGLVAAATLIGVAWFLRKALRQAGWLLACCILVVVLVSGATLCYVACEVLAKIFQLLFIGYLIYGFFASSRIRSVPSATPDHVGYVDFDGNHHDLYRQSDGSYIDYNENSRWNRIEGTNGDRFDRIS